MRICMVSLPLILWLIVEQINDSQGGCKGASSG